MQYCTNFKHYNFSIKDKNIHIKRNQRIVHAITINLTVISSKNNLNFACIYAIPKTNNKNAKIKHAIKYSSAIFILLLELK